MMVLYGQGSAKGNNAKVIALKEDDRLVSDDKNVAGILCNYFVNFTAGLEVSNVEEKLAK